MTMGLAAFAGIPPVGLPQNSPSVRAFGQQVREPVTDSLGEAMTNIEKRPKQTMEQIDQANFSAVPTCARASHLIGQYAENGQNKAGRHQPNGEDRAASFILRFEDLPASPGNIERMRERVRRLNRRLAESGAPFQFRLA
jgi:hypothetical protein